MRNIYFIIFFLIMTNLFGIKVFAQENTKFWSIGHYLKPMPVSQELHKLGLRSVQSGENISTNNLVYPSENPQTEISAAIDKNNTLVLMVGTNTGNTGFIGQGWYATTDGGYNWYGSDYYPNNSKNLGDPVIICDDSSHFFNFSIGFAGEYDISGYPLSHGIQVVKTTDAGQTWDSTITSVDPTYSTGADKPMAVADDNSNSPYKGNLYAAWTDFNKKPGKAVFSRSVDGGTHWSDTLIVLDTSTQDRNQGTSLAVGPAGELYIAWANYTNDNNPASGMGFVKSTDGGETFTEFNGTPAFTYSGIRISNTGIAEFGGIRVNDFPCIAVDRSNGPYRGYIYAVVAENTGRDTINSDIKFARSKDGGETWETGFTNNNGYVNTNRNKQQFFPWMSVDDVTGRISVTYYSQDTVGYAVNTYVALSYDGGQTFKEYKVSDVSHTPQPLYSNGYSGDYINISSHNSKIYPFWMDNRSGPQKYQAYFSYSIYSIDQKLTNTSTFGTVKKWDGSAFNSVGLLPVTLNVPNFSNEILQGEQDIHSKQKYNAWYLNSNKVTEINNHHKFAIRPGKPIYRSQFHFVDSTVIVKTDFISANNESIGDIYFKDPWFIDSTDAAYGDALMNRGNAAIFHQRNSPFRPDFDTEYNGIKYQGVFLDQGWPGWHPPYYSVKAEAQQTFTAHGQDITGYFLNWEGTDVTFQHADQQETPLVFHAENAEARAVYKGHLVSSVARATGYNNGRRMAKDGSGKLHLVYEDHGQTWYTTSTDNGQTWSKEEQVPLIYGLACNPSIAISNGQPSEGIHAHVVWETILTNTNGQEVHAIAYAKRTQNGWDTPEIISEGSLTFNGRWSGPDSRRPAIYAEGSDELHITWASANTIKIINHSSFGTWSSVATVPNAHNGYPEIVLTPTGSQRIRLVWADNGKIKYIGGAYNYDNTWSWTSIYTLSDHAPSFFQNHNNPSITVSGNNHFHVAWECEDFIMEYAKDIVYQEYGSSSNARPVGSLYTIADVDLGLTLKEVSISSNSSGTISFHYDYLDKIYNKLKTGGSWSTYYRGPGQYPSSVFNDIQKGVWTRYTSAPYLLNTENLQNHLSKTAGPVVSAFKRFYYLLPEDSTYLQADLKSFNYEGSPLSFDDTLKTDSITVKGQVSFTFRMDIKSETLKEDETLLTFWFVGDQGKYLLDEVTLEANHEQKSLEKKIYFKTEKPMKGYVQIDFPQQKPYIMNVVPQTMNTALAKKVPTQNGSVYVPESFRLSQNFPNPFNPTTQIVVDLPQEAQITLEVFDINGHKVATLVRGRKAAGSYHVLFDGSKLASGVYIYRLQAGGRTFSKRMLLIK